MGLLGVFARVLGVLEGFRVHGAWFKGLVGLGGVRFPDCEATCASGCRRVKSLGSTAKGSI